MFTFSIIIIIIISYILLKYCQNQSIFTRPGTKLSNINGPRGLPVVGMMFQLLSFDSSDFLNKIHNYLRKWNGLMRCYVLHHKYIFVSILEDVEVILSDTRFFQKSQDYNLLGPWLQNGFLLKSDACKYRRMREAFASALDVDILQDHVNIFDEQVKVMIKVLEKDHTDYQQFDISANISNFLLDAICETSFGIKFKIQPSKLLTRFPMYLLGLKAIMFHRFISLTREDFLWKLTHEKQVHDHYLSQLNRMLDVIIHSRKNRDSMKLQLGSNQYSFTEYTTFLDLLLQLNVNEKPLNHSQISENLKNLFSAAHDTMKSVLTFILYCLAKHRKVQDKAHQEVLQVLGANQSTPITLSQINDLKYLDLVVKETLRLYPPVPLLGRMSNEDVVINGKLYPASHNVIISVFNMHRSEKYFNDPLEFKPERFLEQKTHLCSYLPFSMGERSCIGQKFGQYEIKIVVARLLQEFEISLGSEDFEPKLGFLTKLVSNNGMYLKLRKREY